MADQTNELKQLVSELAVEDSVKQQLLERLDKEGPTESLMLEIKKQINAVEEKLVAQMDKAQQEFDTEMDAIDQETSKLNQQLSEEVDKIDIDSARAAIQKH